MQIKLNGLSSILIYIGKKKVEMANAYQLKTLDNFHEYLFIYLDIFQLLVNLYIITPLQFVPSRLYLYMYLTMTQRNV